MPNTTTISYIPIISSFVFGLIYLEFKYAKGISKCTYKTYNLHLALGLPFFFKKILNK